MTARLLRLLSLLCFILMCNGCSSLWGSDPVPAKPEEPRELTKSKDAPKKAQPEIQLLDEAQRNYERGLYSVAKESFTRIKEDYPAGAYAEYAGIKAADCLFEQKDFRASSKAYEDAVNSAPSTGGGGKHADYLLYRAALSHKLLNPGSARDTSRLERSKELFNRLLKDYPKSPYSNLAKQQLNEIDHDLADTDLKLLAYYEERNKGKASAERNKEFKTKYGVEARTFEAEEVAKSEDSSTESDSPKSETSEADKANEVPLPARNPAPPQHGVYISALTCDPASSTAILEIGGDVASFSADMVTKVEDARGIEIQSPVAKRAPKNGDRSDCLSRDDLTISSQGEFMFLGADRIEVDTTSTPPRIIVGINTN